MRLMNVRPLLLSLASLGAGVSGYAQTWDGGGFSGAWSNFLNWNPNILPVSTNIVSFNAAAANSQYSITLGADRTVAGFVFINAAGTNVFTFNSGNKFNVGASGLVNNDADRQIFNSDLTLTASQTWNAASGGFTAAGTVTITGVTLTYDGSADSTISGRIVGAGGALTKNGSGMLTLTVQNNSFDGGVIVNAGTLRVTYSGNIDVARDGFNDHLGQGDITVNSGGTIEVAPTSNFTGLKRELTLNGGILKLNPGVAVSSLISGSGQLTFTTNGGTLQILKPLTGGVSLGTTVVNANTATPGVIQYGFISNPSGTPYGWDLDNRELRVQDGDMTGTGRLRFELTNGAMVRYEDSSFGGSLVFSGVSGGDASAGSASALVGRLMFNAQSTFSITNGIFFENAMQVTTDGGASRTINANITVNSGEVAFQGRSKNSATSDALIIGNASGVNTLTVKNGATATMDARFRDESSLNNVAGVTLNANTILEAGGTLNFTKSATIAGETVAGITVNGDITGQGTTANESTILLGLGAGTAGVSFTSGAGTAGSDLIVNGTGLGGLRIVGSGAQVTNLLTSARLQDVTGSGGVLTIAYNDSFTGRISSAPTSGSLVRLGFDNGGAGAPVYQLGSSVNDLANWGGLVVKGGTVRVMQNESITGSGAITTSLDMLGGNLILNDGSNARTLTFEGGANLTAGNLNSGTLVLGSGVVFGASMTFSNAPNITINNSGAASISGSSVSGLGTVTKQGAGTLTLNTGLSANTIDIQSGTLLMGGDNLIGNSTAIRLGGGTLGTGGNDDTVGTLTLAANSTIDFGSGSSILHFANSSAVGWTNGTTLYIANWDGAWKGGGTDQLFFGNALGSLSGGQISQIRFLNPNGLPIIMPGLLLSTGEIVPVPEPATVGLGALLLGSLGFRERARLAKWARYLRNLFAAA